ncbi:hypothetical protein NEAUS03_1397 [Nematocida ausubeli]|nr:hypothetical protein NEAUS03_1397 [Nematocida ausubeli]
MWKYCILIIHMVCLVVSRIEIEDLKVAQKRQFFNDGKEPKFINPNGPLNLLRGYIYHKNGYMHNKRLFSHELDVKYKFESVEDEHTGVKQHIFTRLFHNDTAHPFFNTVFQTGSKNEEEKKLKKYICAYHSKLVHMFNENDIYVSIASGKSDSLIHFLKYEPVRKYSKYILASLLLLSEGFGVPISFTTDSNKKTFLNIWKKDSKDVHCTVCMDVPGYNPVTDSFDDIPQKEAKSIIDFFICHHKSKFLKKTGELAEPNSFDEFSKGAFLNSLGFLIQMYIFEFIDNAHDVIEFVQAVYEILIEYLPSNSNASNKQTQKALRLFNRCFAPIDNISIGLEYIETAERIREIKAINRVLPFFCLSQVPMFCKIPEYCSTSGTYLSEYTNYFTNCGETALLGLFCCLLYDAATQKYTTTHLKRPDPKLVAFFDKYKNPRESASLKMHNDWNKVISNRSIDDLGYASNKNQMVSGILNMLYLIVHLTGNYVKESPKIAKLSAYASTNELSNVDLHTKLSCYIMKLLSKISKNKNFTCLLSKICIGTRTDNKTDVFALIELKYTYSQITQCAYISFMPRHSLFIIFEAIGCPFKTMELDLFLLSRNYSKKKSFIEILLHEYIIQNMHKFQPMYPMNIVNNIKNTVQLVVKDDFKTMNRLHLIEPLEYIYSKSEMVCYCLMLCCKENLNAEHPIIRFTSNILSSISLSSPCYQERVLPPLVYFGLYKNHYPYIQIDESRWNEIALGKRDCPAVFRCALDIGAPDIFIKALDMYSKLDKNANMSNTSPFYSHMTIKAIFRCLFKNHETANAFEVLDILKRNYPEKGSAICNHIILIWIVYICSQKDYPERLIIDLFNRLEENASYGIEFVIYIDKVVSKEHHTAVEVLQLLEHALIRQNNGAKKFSEMMCALNKMAELVKKPKKTSSSMRKFSCLHF